MSCQNNKWTANSWEQVSSTIGNANPELAGILNALVSKENGPKYYTARYRFGDEIIADGHVKLPCECDGCIALQNRLSGCSKDQGNNQRFPLGLVVNRRVEVLGPSIGECDLDPRRLLQPGELFGTFEIAELLSGQFSAPPWTLHAGARSIIPLWANRNRPLQIAIRGVFAEAGSSYHSKLPAPGDSGWKNITWWTIIKELSREFDKSWHVDLIWIDIDWENVKFGEELRAYVFEVAWNQNRPSRDRQRDDINSLGPHERSLARVGRIIDGNLIGYTPALQDDACGPFHEILHRLFKKIFEDLAVKSKTRETLRNALAKTTLPYLMLPIQENIRNSRHKSVPLFYLLQNPNDSQVKPIGGSWTSHLNGLLVRAKGEGGLLDQPAKLQVAFVTQESTRGKDEYDCDLMLYPAYMKNLFPKDFRDQIAIAKESGVTDPAAAFTKKHSAIAAFVRVSNTD